MIRSRNLFLSLVATLALAACQRESASAADAGAGNAMANSGYTLDESKLPPVTNHDMADLDTGKRACTDLTGIEVELHTDPHAPGHLRVIVPLLDTEAFARAFDCKAGDPMVRDGDKRIRELVSIIRVDRR